jgi:hypothetical protein
MHPIAIPLLATHPGHTCLSRMAMSPPPSHLHGYIAAPSSRTRHSTACLAAARLRHPPPPFQPHSPHHRTPSCTAMALPPLQLHMSPPLCHLYGPCCSTPRSWTHYAAAPIAAMHAASLQALPLHGLCHPPGSHTALPHASQLGRPCHPFPLSRAGHVAMCLAAGWATSPPSSQPGTPCRCMPRSWMGHVAASLTATHAMSLCAS